MVGPGTLQGRRLRKTACTFVPENTYLKLERLGTLGKGGLCEVSVIGRYILLLSFSCQVVSHSLWPCGLQHARFPCPTLPPRVCSNSSPLSRWCHPTISSSVVPFSSCPQSVPASGSFPMSRLFTSGGQSIGASSFSIGPFNEYSELISIRIDWLDLLAVQKTLKESSPVSQFKSINSWAQCLLYSKLSHFQV